MIRAILVAALLAGCGGSATTPKYSDAEQERLLSESIDLLYADAEWYPTMTDLHVEDGWAFVITRNPALAEAMCRDIARGTFDDDAEPIGITDVMVGGLDAEPITDCDVP